ncbi:MAG: DNA topoisomerase I [Candidatus Altiarchaeota archaeon]
MTQLILTEKPDVAERIASALGQAKKHVNDGVRYYEVSGNYVVPAVGHIYGLSEKKGGHWVYPVFDIDWVPSYKMSKDSAFTKKYLENIKKISAKCDEYVNACDYDIEGEVIGFNVIKYACGKDPIGAKTKRMKYSTLTKESIQKSYQNLQKPDSGMAYAGLARHVLDWYWGINMSRALSLSMRAAGRYTTLSVGRVQGPTLHVLAEREKQIKEFKIEPYWQVELHTEKGEVQVKALHTKDKIWDEEEAKKIKEKCGKKATVESIQRNKFQQPPPYPFDLTTLQTEAYRCFKIDPRRTLEIAQNLYTNAYISYPRTASQKLPPDIDFAEIIGKLSKLSEYKKPAEKLLAKGKLSPANGKKDDPAHPAIHPTGERIQGLDGQSKKIFDLVVRRFFATFADQAHRETVSVTFNNNEEKFLAKGTTTTEEGWHEYYKPYVKLDETLLPAYAEKEVIDVQKTKIVKKETQPPKRYTPASIVREMEKREIGTKATRAQILDILYKRGYITSERIQVTDLGLSVVDTLEQYCPEVVSEELTREFEHKMDEIQANKTTREKVIEEGRKTIEKISQEFKKNEKEIGRSLLKPMYQSQIQKDSLGKCLKCDGLLMLRNSQHGNFIGCSNYPNCRYTISLPKGNLKRSGTCKNCNYATLEVRSKKPWRFCINPECPSKKR